MLLPLCFCNPNDDLMCVCWTETVCLTQSSVVEKLLLTPASLAITVKNGVCRDTKRIPGSSVGSLGTEEAASSD